MSATSKIWGDLSSKNRFMVMLLGVCIVILIVLNLTRLTDGRAGFTRVKGDSLSSWIPEGSTVFTWPLAPVDRSWVTAVTWEPDQKDQLLPLDYQRKLSVKLYTVESDGKPRLISTDAAESYGRFEYRGKVVMVLHTERWFPWLNTGSQAPKGPQASSVEPVVTDEQYRQTASRMEAVGKGREVVMPHTTNANFATQYYREWKMKFQPTCDLRVWWRGEGTVRYRFGDCTGTLLPSKEATGRFLHSSVIASTIVLYSVDERNLKCRITPCIPK